MDIKSLINDVKETEGERKILILSDDKVGADSYDANVFVALIELSKAFPEKERITYITELLDSRNLASVKDFNIHNTIISNRMMSLLITQLALNKSSKKFFEKVLTISTAKVANDFDIAICEANQSVVIKEDMKFESKADLLRTYYNTPVLIIIKQNQGFNDYDRPTTIEKYLNYVKDQKKATEKVHEIKYNDSGKINELELIKK